VFGDSDVRNRSEPSEYRPDDPATARTAATTDPGQEERVQTIELSIEGMSCEHCVARVKKALEAVSGVSRAEVDLEPGSATVTGADIRLEDLVEAVDRVGYTASAA
jgi:copper chaperone CopZ